MIKKITMCVKDKINAVKGRLCLLSLNLVSPVPCFANDEFQITSAVTHWATWIGSAGAIVGMVLVAYAGWKMILGNMDAGKEKMIHSLLGIGIATTATTVGVALWGGSGAVI